MSTNKVEKAPQPDRGIAADAERRVKAAALFSALGVEKPIHSPGAEVPVPVVAAEVEKDMSVVGKRIKAGTATQQEIDAYDRAIADGRRFGLGKTIDQRNEELAHSQAKLAVDPREAERAREDQETAARWGEANRRRLLQLMQIDACLNKYRAYGVGTAPLAEARKNLLRADLERDLKSAGQKEGVLGCEKVLDRYEKGLIPTAIVEIDGFQSALMLAVSEARQVEERNRIEAAARKVGPDKALAVVEAALGERLRLTPEQEIEVPTGGLGENEMAIVQLHYGAIVAALKQREDRKPLTIKRSK